MVKEVAFGGPEKAWRMKVIGFVLSLLGVMTTGCKRQKDQGNGRDVSERVSDDVSLDAEF